MCYIKLWPKSIQNLTDKSPSTQQIIIFSPSLPLICHVRHLIGRQWCTLSWLRHIPGISQMPPTSNNGWMISIRHSTSQRMNEEGTENALIFSFCSRTRTMLRVFFNTRKVFFKLMEIQGTFHPLPPENHHPLSQVIMLAISVPFSGNCVTIFMGEVVALLRWWRDF